tara:strand:+ start:728 stop:1174 length:447 start_codon:yes stop_codon:yes gene_type:complete
VSRIHQLQRSKNLLESMKSGAIVKYKPKGEIVPVKPSKPKGEIVPVTPPTPKRVPGSEGRRAPQKEMPALPAGRVPKKKTNGQKQLPQKKMLALPAPEVVKSRAEKLTRRLERTQDKNFVSVPTDKTSGKPIRSGPRIAFGDPDDLYF